MRLRCRANVSTCVVCWCVYYHIHDSRGAKVSAVTEHGDDDNDVHLRRILILIKNSHRLHLLLIIGHDKRKKFSINNF